MYMFFYQMKTDVATAQLLSLTETAHSHHTNSL